MSAPAPLPRRSKGPIRSLNRRGTRFDKSPLVKHKTRRLREPTVCERCGAVFSRHAWRQTRLPSATLGRARWSLCPACTESKAGEHYGRVLVRGSGVAANLDAIRDRIRDVSRRAAFTQPQRRVLYARWDGATLEVLTTSQKLAHRIVREIEKAFGGKSSYAWSDVDGSLFATLQIEPRLARGRTGRTR